MRNAIALRGNAIALRIFGRISKLRTGRKFCVHQAAATGFYALKT